MNFIELAKKLHKENITKEEIKDIVENIDISSENFEEWVNDIFSDKVTLLDLNNLPLLIDELYQSNIRLKFLLSCMLLEATCDIIPYITNLERYILDKYKYSELRNTLVTVYSNVDNGIADCMADIILINDPRLELFDEEEKNMLTISTKRKLNLINKYLEENEKVEESAYDSLEIIVDLACFMHDEEITRLIEKLDKKELNFGCKLFILKYKLTHKIKVNNIDSFFDNREEMERIISVFEKSSSLELLPIDKIKQEDIAYSNMISWLRYPTELGTLPDKIELLDKIDYKDNDLYIYKFKKNDFKIQGELLGISGAYPKNRITTSNYGHTFSKFEQVEEDYKKQAIDLADFIENLSKEKQN